MKAIILAAGRGSRMKGLTKDQPKCLLKVNGKPLIEWQLEAITHSGIDEIAIVTGYKKNMLSTYGLKEFHNSRWSDTQMVFSLACASDWLKSGPCIVSYSDIFFEPPLILSLLKSSSLLTLTYDPDWLDLWADRFDDPLSDAESFKLNPDGSLAEIGGKPITIEEIEGQYMGLMKFTPTAWEELENVRRNLPTEERDMIHMTGIFQKLVEQKNIIIGTIPNRHKWGEVDSENDLLQSNKRMDRTSVV